MRRPPRMTFDRVLIVGGGRAGASAAEELRRLGFQGEIVALCAEPDRPYDRPACSKGLLTGHQRPFDVMLSLDDSLDVRWRMGRSATYLDPAARVVETDTGEAYRYDGLIIASGARAVAPPDWPLDQPGIHLLHGLADAWALRRDLRDADTVAVVGAGLTGCETASAVRALARKCVLVDSSPQVMTRALGGLVAGFVTEELARQGVALRLGRRVRQVERGRRHWRLCLDDGSEFDADVVVATTGERPDTRWLEPTRGLDLTDGVLCDEYLRVVGAHDVVAAGSVARWPNLRLGAEPRRCGQWIAAQELGRAAAGTLLAAEEPIEPVTLLPRFWSHQFGLRIQVCGDIPPDAEISLTRLHPRHRHWARSGVLLTYTHQDRLVAVAAVNAPSAFNAVTRPLLAAASRTPAVAADPATSPSGRPPLWPPDAYAVRHARHLAAVS
jgi:NADPH-dependent 2,4-dienoyl-CoA reductase/sulfur reductase-like enzyme